MFSATYDGRFDRTADESESWNEGREGRGGFRGGWMKIMIKLHVQSLPGQNPQPNGEWEKYSKKYYYSPRIEVAIT